VHSCFVALHISHSVGKFFEHRDILVDVRESYPMVLNLCMSVVLVLGVLELDLEFLKELIP